MAGIGGVNVSAYGPDAFSFWQNPAMGRADEMNRAGLSYNPYSGLFKNTNVSGVFAAKGYDFGAGLSYITYGSLAGYDAQGNATGDFSATEYAFRGNASMAQGPFRLGATLVFAGQAVAGYTSNALGVDLGGLYSHPTKDLKVGLTIKNIGGVVKKLTPDLPGGTLPLNIALGTSCKFEHMPLRISATLQQLQKWDIVFQDPTISVKTNADGTEQPLDKKFADKAFRHLVVGGEFVFSKSFHLRFGYNHLARKELRMVLGPSGGAGFALGTMIKIKRITFDYTHSFGHVAGGSNFLGLAYDFGKKS